MTITKTTQFNAALAINENDGGITNYASFSGSVDSMGVPSMSYYISDEGLYKSNLKVFREAWSDFQNVVFDEADKVSAALDSTATEE